MHDGQLPRTKSIPRAASGALRAAALSLVVASCSATLPGAGERPGTGREEVAGPALARVAEPEVDRVVLVTIDGVRWQEIFRGADPALADSAGVPRGEERLARSLTPHLHRLFFDGGTVLGDPSLGRPVEASGPRFVSLPAYVELMTGAVSGCGDNDCEPRLPWTIASEVAAQTPEQGAAVFASWGAIARALRATPHLFASAGRPPGDDSAPHPGHGDYRPDRGTAAAALARLSGRLPGLSWIALGDTDEWAHRRDYRGYLSALRFADAFVGELCDRLDRDPGRRTAVIVTTDHGRDPGFADHGGPESAAVWLMARGGPIRARGSAGLAATRHLRDIAPTIARLFGWESRRCAGCGASLPELF